MTGFVIGIFAGAFLGVTVMCLLRAASDADDAMENQQNERDYRHE
ncbi:MAG: DUF3789 domain-containing protein [Clostridia bacterium]|nr:DUF3789 domain-containing protein [Clostridia bacterium]